MLGSADQLQSLDLPIDRERAFSDPKGRHKPRLEKKQLKLLKKAAPLIRKVLEPEEKIHFVTFGCSPYSLLEFFTTGWLILYIRRCLLVVTDRRLLHLPTKGNLDPKMSVAQIRYGDVTELKVTSGLGRKLTVTYRDGGREKFTGLPGWAAKKLKLLLASRSGHGRASAVARRQYLCPRCTAALAAESASCAGCGLPFKDKKRALKYSILYPGGGYFYTRHPWLGIADALFETLLILGIVAVLVVAFVDPESWLPEDWATLGFLAVLLVLEKLVTIYHAQHYVAERMPGDRKFSLAEAPPDPLRLQA